MYISVPKCTPNGINSGPSDPVMYFVTFPGERRTLEGSTPLQSFLGDPKSVFPTLVLENLVSCRFE